jgi:5-amino-6-(5-phosphoribosylamino)uracil reductase
MIDKPYVLVKCAMSIDGFIDDTSKERLILSDNADFERVDSERAECDAILLGAEAVRKDNPRLLIRSEEKRNIRLNKGLPENPIKVTLTTTGNLSSSLNFFTVGNSQKVIYCGCNSRKDLLKPLENLCRIVFVPTPLVDPKFILHDLANHGINKLMVEGGTRTLTDFLTNGLVDELQISIAPFFVGESLAPRFVNSGTYVNDKTKRMKLTKIEMVGDMALLTYSLLNK